MDQSYAIYTGPAVLKMREATQKQLDLQQLLFRKMEVQEHFVLGQQLQAALQSCSAELERASISIPEATGLLDFEKSEAIPPNSLLYKIDKYDKVRACGSCPLVNVFYTLLCLVMHNFTCVCFCSTSQHDYGA